ncbi:hypothetical protein AJ85_14380 [Alkalihalobacillus alcalophilus ATCC 27647 = CGMCC 1.3604]|uniref:Uncharacterized protein n=1 Tax=Alkalihalobacillus alcalophilus ATCC 27647 = CGMCC 1.3604 TaxID=1218173 RepID=A0A094WQJ4_ALKAL|nr:hypothetical protein BALCAV_0205035 [Alkalihalobacillus alcalophilus ATCC 27647 = CGMCC 1.3604]THG89947.1 hypothetical protein AJ85_14380 [Alkalihalobacillus alcalophilus ATCC 27647 = CGMCC 1.3604]
MENRSRFPGNPWCSSWIYREEAINFQVDLADDSQPKVEQLLEKLDNKLFTDKNKSFIKEFQKNYEVNCDLLIFTFGSETIKESFDIPHSLLKNLVDINAKLEINTHSKPLSYYKELYKYQKLFEI